MIFILAGKLAYLVLFIRKNVVLGGDVSVKDNIRIGQDTVVAGASKVLITFRKEVK